MPYPCVYIEEPYGVDDCDGVFCFLEWDQRYPGATELRLHYLMRDGSIVALFPQWANDRELLFAKMEADNEKLLRKIRGLPDFHASEKAYTQCVEHMNDHINMLLYLCSDDPDVTNRNPVPRKKGSGVVQTAAYPDRMDVGHYIGSVLRRNRDENLHENLQSDPAPTSVQDSVTRRAAPVRPHMRRAHWHLYWTGEGRRIPKIKWVLPVFVKGSSGDKHTVIHPVK